MPKLANRAWMSSATTGTGTLTLGSALSGYQSFAAAGVVNLDSVRYLIIDGVNWELGTGTYTSSGTTLSRTVLESTNADAAINLSGSATVLITVAAEDILVTIAFANMAASAIATATEHQAATASKLLASASIWDAAAEIFSLTDAATIAVDMSVAWNFTVTLGGNRTLGNPTNKKVGQTGVIRVLQDATGNRTLSFASDWENSTIDTFVASTGVSASDFLFYYVRASDAVVITGYRKTCV